MLRVGTIFLSGLIGLAVLAGLGGCANGGGDSGPLKQPDWGFNLLQSREIPFTEPPTRESLERMAAAGATHVVLVAFLEQPTLDAVRPDRGAQVTDEQLNAAVRTARDVGLEVMLKPQLLVDGSWAGEIDPPSVPEWFDGYRDHLIHYAEIAAREGVRALVIGTEMASLGDATEWERVIADIRQVYGGKLTYAAHNVEGIRQFESWDLLDAVGVTLYPSYGVAADRKTVRRRIYDVLNELERATSELWLPVWILEIGHPSATGSMSRPWDWRRLDDPGVAPAPELQAMVLEEWTNALTGMHAVDSVSVWSWYNDTGAGGTEDTGYTVQNKPAEPLLRCLWLDECP